MWCYAGSHPGSAIVSNPAIFEGRIGRREWIALI
jgi:hypothetical protein